MKKDFHYYCIAVLAEAAGFVKKDALTIAYASQYVDNATESEPIRVGKLMFDPVRTAHMGLKAFDWAVQKRVYIPFHFIPPKSIEAPHDSFVTQPNSEFARAIFDEACKGRTKKLRRLCRMGVALHTLADTWAHQGFSGRRDNENDVEKIRIRKDGKRWSRPFLENILLDIPPQIGHAEAGVFPDQPFLTWKYLRKAANVDVQRNNTDEFLKAAKTIYDLLRGIKKTKSDKPIPWKRIQPRIKKRLADTSDDHARCENWKDDFEEVFHPLKLHYDKREWRNDALQPRKEKDTAWDEFSRSRLRRLSFPMTPGFYDSPWVHFHRAALKQRHFVLERLL